MLPSTRLAAVALAFSIAMTVAWSARGAIVIRSERLLAAENCQAALPSFDGRIRKRPLAVQNESGATAFVTCAMKGTLAVQAINQEVRVWLINNGGAARNITCTLVDGRNLGLSDPIFLTKSTTVATADSSEIVWLPADNGGNAFLYPALSCGLPPGTGIRYTGRLYQYED